MSSFSERERLEALAAYDILDTPPEEAFDRIVRLMSAHYDVAAATVAFVGGERTWGKAYTGFDPSISREDSFCLHVVVNDEPLVLEDPRRDPAFADNPLVTGAPGVRFYAGVPVRTPDDIPVGTACLYDTEPRSFASASLERLRDFAGLVEQTLEQRRAGSAAPAPPSGRADAPAETADEDLPSNPPDGVLRLDACGRIEWADDRFVAISGYTREELRGKCPGRLLYGPATDPDTTDAIDRHLEADRAFSVPILLYRKSGTQYWVRIEAEPRHDETGACTGFRLALFDITEARQRDDALSALSSFYEEVLRTLPVEVGVLDPQGRYLFLNPAAVGDDELREWLIGKTAVDYARRRGRDPALFEERLEMVRRVAETGEPESIEEPMPTDEGAPRYVLRVAQPVTDASGTVVRVFIYGVDVTERKQREQNLRAAKERAEEMNRLKTAFLANMSHEIRTPLTSIIGFAELLADEATGRRRKMADLIRRSGGRLKETLTSVLELARLEGDAITLTPERLDLAERVRETVELLRPQVQSQAVTLALEGVDGSVSAELDRAALDRILTNLLTNAIKFTEEGQITVTLRPASETVTVVVADTGCGIDEAFLQRIYDAFEQESSGMTRTHEGVGLGLTITQRLVRLMGGSIDIESEKGEGTTVAVTLPRHAAPEPAPPAAEAAPL
jgi:PAS domain S-box-containing protein